MQFGAAMIKNNTVINVIVVELSSLSVLEKALIDNGDCDHLIIVDDNVHIGCTYEDSTGIFYNEDGQRVFPELTTDEKISALNERINELETALDETQMALIETVNNSEGLNVDESANNTEEV